jgi:hypothetical protein
LEEILFYINVLNQNKKYKIEPKYKLYFFILIIYSIAVSFERAIKVEAGNN